MTKQPLIIGVGGGKGGVGKSMVSANLAVSYAQMGFKVALFDLDFGAANLHTLFGIRSPKTGLGDFFFTSKSSLEDYFIKTSLSNLSFAPGSGYIPELANLKYPYKLKLMKQLRKIDAEIILLDLGAGSSYNVVDFFAMTDVGLIVATPEPTAITNAYEFLKNVVYRSIFRAFRNDRKTLQLLKEHIDKESISELLKILEEKDPWAKETISHLMKHFRLYILINQAQKVSQVSLGEKLQQISNRYLSLELNYAGILFKDSKVSQSVFKMSPISLINPQSTITKGIYRVADTLMEGFASKALNSLSIEDFSAQVKRVYSHAFSDYEAVLLENKRKSRAY